MWEGGFRFVFLVYSFFYSLGEGVGEIGSYVSLVVFLLYVDSLFWDSIVVGILGSLCIMWGRK